MNKIFNFIGRAIASGIRFVSSMVAFAVGDVVLSRRVATARKGTRYENNVFAKLFDTTAWAFVRSLLQGYLVVRIALMLAGFVINLFAAVLVPVITVLFIITVLLAIVSMCDKITLRASVA